MEYKNLRKLNDYVQANDWGLHVYEIGKSITVSTKNRVVIAEVEGYLEIDTSTYIEFVRLTDNQKRTLFDLLVEVASLTDEERFEMYTDEEYSEMLNQNDRKHDNAGEELEICE